MITAAVLLACPHLAVPARLMYHVAMVESDANPYAIGVVGGRLLRQPVSLDEAIATARSLEAQGYNFSVGVAQVNHANLKKYGLDTYERAFSICDNLLAGSRILAQCYSDADGVWGKAFSCYYSGDFTTGYRDGYVQRVLASLSRGGAVARAGAVSGVSPIPATPSAADSPSHLHRRSALRENAAYRVAIRSSFPDTTANADVTRFARKLSRSDPESGLQAAVLAGRASAPSAGTSDRLVTPASPPSPPTPVPAASSASAGLAQAFGGQEAKAFVPQVDGLNGLARQKFAVNGQAPPPTAPSATDPKGSLDAAFVF